MNTLIIHLNQWGEQARHFVWPMLWQSSVFIGLVYLLDCLLRKRVAANVRYLFWLLVLLKLLVPPGVASPTSLAWWLWPPAEEPRAKPFTIVYETAAVPFPTLAVSHNAVVLPTPALSIEAWGLTIWAGVGLGIFAVAIRRGFELRRQTKHAAPASSGLDQLLVLLQQETGFGQPVSLRITSQPVSPALFGLFRPIILLPESMVDRLSTPQLRAVLLHELLHLGRRDVWVQCAQAFLQIVYWWHPLVWFANLRIRRVREEAVDDAVVRILSAEADIYPRTLLEVARLALPRPMSGLGIVGILESGKAFRSRIERLLGPSVPMRKPSMLWFGAIILFSAVALPMGKAPAKSARDPASVESGKTNIQSARTNLIKILQARGVTFNNYLISSRNSDGGAEYDLNTGMVRATNGAFLTMGKTVVIADDIELNRETGRITAKGDVYVKNPEFQVRAEQLNLDRVRSRSESQAGHGPTPDQLPLMQNIFENTPTTVLPANGLGGLLERKTEVIGVDGAMLKYAFAKKKGVNPGSNEEIRRSLGKLLDEAVGIDPSTGQQLSCFYHDLDGHLLLTGTPRQIELAKNAINELLATSPAITLKASFFELPEEALATLITEQLRKFPLPHISLKNPTSGVRILTQKETGEFLNRLKKMDGVDLKNSFSVTTRSGRRASMCSGELLGPDLPPPKAHAAQPSSTTLDITPTLESDSSTIDLQLHFLVTDFLGYDDLPGGGGPLPHYRLRGVLETLHYKLLAEQSAVIANPDSFQTRDREQKTGALDDRAKRILAIITATIVDETGNPASPSH
jgi:beta-lactamase regulating signal transducer with metallopeptidase domain